MSDVEQLRRDYREHLRVLLDGMTRSMTGLPAGPRRLLVAVEAYWELCFRRRAERSAMIQAARATESEALLSRLAQIFERMLTSELTACGVTEPRTLAHSLYEEIRAIARAELIAGHRLPEQRERLVSFLESRLVTPVPSAGAA